MAQEEAWDLVWTPMLWWALVQCAITTTSFGMHQLGRAVENDFNNRRKILGSADDGQVTLDALVLYIDWILLAIMTPNSPVSVDFVFNLMQIITSSVSCVVFVSNVSTQLVYSFSAPLNITLAAFFALDYIRRAIFVESGQSWRYFLRLDAMLDLLSIISIVYSAESWLSFVFLRAWILVRTITEMKDLITDYLFHLSSVYSQIFILAVESIGLIFIFASIIYIVETLGPIEQDYDPSSLTMFTSIYFIFITLATVGYGDFAAKTMFGRIFVIVFVVLGVAVFANNTNKIFNLMRESKRGFGKFLPRYGESFVIVSGDSHFQSVQSFLQDLLLSDKTVKRWQRHKLHAVILMKGDAEFEENLNRFIEQEAPIRRRVTYVNGSALDSYDLVHRAHAEIAEAVFIIPTFVKNNLDGDSSNIMRAMAVQRICPEVPLFLAVEHPSFRSIFSATSLKTQACLFSNRLFMDVLAISCKVPAFSTFLYGVLKWFGEELKDQPQCSNRQEWVSGLEQQVHVVLADYKFVGRSLGEVSLIVYRFFCGRVITIGVANAEHDCTGNIAKYKYSFSPSELVEDSALLFLLAKDTNDVSQIGACAPPDQVLSEESSSFYNTFGPMRIPLQIPAKYSSAAKSKSPKRVGPVALERVASFSRKIVVQKYSSSESESVEITDQKSSRNFARKYRLENELEGKVELPSPHSDLKDHIVVICATTKDLGFFIRKIRMMEQRNEPRRDILIICESNYKSSHFGVRGSYLQDVYFYQGKLKNFADFRRCKLENAERIVIVSFSAQDVEFASVSEEVLTDSNAVFLWHRIQKYLSVRTKRNFELENPVLVELRSINSMKFIQPAWQACHCESKWFSPEFAQGSLVLHGMGTLLLMNAFAKQGSLGFILHLTSQAGRSHQIQLEDVDPDRTPTFNALYSWHLSEDVSTPMFAVALYRADEDPSDACIMHSCNRFVYIAPTAETKLRISDKVLLIGGLRIGVGETEDDFAPTSPE